MPTKAATAGAASPRCKKRSASSFSSGDETKKTRGRPRVDPQDQTAADRRRTQIRLAQRSYRQRKEGTITDLQTKVSQLEVIISEMNDTYQDLSRNTVSSSGNPDLNFSRKIADAAERFMELTRNVKRQKMEQRASSQDSTSESPPDDYVEPPRSAQNQLASSVPPKSSAQKHSSKVGPTIVSTSERGVPSVWGYETIYPSQTDFSVKSFANSSTSHEPQNLQLQSFDHSQALVPSNAFIPSFGPPTPFADPNYYPWISPNMEMPSPMSYSHFEHSFARRLHRNITESAIRLLSLTHPPGRRLNQVFGHVMKYYSQMGLRDMFIQSLRVDSNATLESKSVYPYLGPLTTQNWLVDQTDEKARAELLDAPDNKNEGTWYQPNDVQEFLKQKGIDVPPGASYVDWEFETFVTVWPSQPWPSPAASSNGDGTPTHFDGNMLPLNPTPPYELPPKPMSSAPPAQQQPVTPASSMTSDVALNLQQMNVPQLNNLGPYTQGQGHTYFYPPAATRNQESTIASTPKVQRVPAKFTVDVTKFMAELLQVTCCLGKTPGFRRRDVETAFERSLIAVPLVAAA